MRISRPPYWLVLIVTALLLVLFHSAAAHGVLEGSSPAAGASLVTSPRQVVLQFSEPVAEEFSTVAILDREGQHISSPARLTRSGRTLVTDLPLLDSGVYTVRWRVLSTLDGHVTSGFFVFAIGEQAPSGTPGTSAATPPALLVGLRWIEIAAAMLVAGIAFFEYLIIRPGQSQALATGGLVWTARVPLRRLTVAAATVVLLALTAEFILQAAMLLDASLARLMTGGLLWPLLTSTKAGWGTVIRAVMSAMFLLPITRRGRLLRAGAVVWAIVTGAVISLVLNPGVATGSRHLLHLVALLLVATAYGLITVISAIILPLVPDVRLPEGAWAPPVAAAFLLAGFTMSSHAAGIGPLAAAIDWLHLLAAALWIGGLVSLLVVLRTAPEQERAKTSQLFVPRFSAYAAAGLGVLIVTGIYSAWIHIPALRAFIVTAYGEMLLVKIGLVAVLIVLGGLNRFVLRPRLERGNPDRRTMRRFLQSVSAEVVLGVLVFLIVASLTITPPATVTMPAAAGAPIVLAGQAGPMPVQLAVIPLGRAQHRFEVTIPPDESAPLNSDTRVFLRVLKLDEDLDAMTVMMQPRGERKYQAEGAQLALSGWWEIEVVVRRRGALDQSTAFPLRTGVATRRASQPEAIDLLDRARRTMESVRSWRDVQQIADGSGGMIVTMFEAARPDRLRYRTSGGFQAVFVGSEQYIRDGSAEPWRRKTVSSPLALPGPYLEFLTGAQGVVLGRRVQCEAEPCRVVLWEDPGRGAAFAGWVGLRTLRVHKILMVAPAHYMTAQIQGVNIPVRIEKP